MANGERDVLFTLKVVPDDSVQSELRSFAQAMKKAERQGTAAAKRASKERADAKSDEIARRKNAERVGLENDKRFMGLSVKEQDRVLKNRRRLLAKFHADQRRAQQKAAREQEKVQRAQQKEAAKLAATQRKEQEKATREREREINRLTRAQESSSNEVQAQNAQMLDAIGETTGGLATLGRGFLALGIQSEETTAKQLAQLARIQGGFDLVVGTITTVRGTAKAIAGFRGALDAARAAQQAAAASAALSTKASQANALALGREAAAANSAAAAHSRLTVSRNTGTAAGTLRTVTAGAGGGAGLFGGAAAAGAAGAAAPIAGIAAATAALGGLALLVRDLNDGFSTVAGSGFKVGSGFDRLGTFVANLNRRTVELTGVTEDTAFGLGGLQKDFIRLADSAKELRAVQRRQIEDERIRRQDQILARRQIRTAQAERASGRSIEELLLLQGNQTGTRQQQSLNISDTISARERLSELRAQRRTAGGLAREEIDAEILRLEERRVQLAKERAGIERQIGEQQRADIREQISGQQRQLELAKSRIQTEKNRGLSVLQRFGQLSAEEQRESLLALRKARAGGNLSRRESRALSRVGSREAERRSRAADIRRAVGTLGEAGARDLIGEERQRVSRNQALQQQLEADIRVNQELLVTVQMDEDEIVRQVVNEVVVEVERRNQSILAQIQREASEALQRNQAQAAERQRNLTLNQQG